MAINLSLYKEADGRFISVLVEELADEGRLRFTATVDGADDGFGGIRTILFDLGDVDLIKALSVVGDDVVGAQFAVDGVSRLDDSANLEGGVRPHNDFFPFDAGVAFGSGGPNTGGILSTAFIVGSSDRALTLDDLDLDRVGVRLETVSSGHKYARLEAVEISLEKKTDISNAEDIIASNDAADVTAYDVEETFASSVAGVKWTSQTGQDEAFAGKSASADTAGVSFAPATFKGAPLEPLGDEATIIADLDRSKIQTYARVPYTQLQFGRDQIEPHTDERAGINDQGSEGGGLRNALSEKILSHDPALKGADVAKMNNKSGFANKAAEKAAESDNNLGLDFRIFIDGGSDEMLF